MKLFVSSYGKHVLNGWTVGNVLGDGAYAQVCIANKEGKVSAAKITNVPALTKKTHMSKGPFLKWCLKCLIKKLWLFFFSKFFSSTKEWFKKCKKKKRVHEDALNAKKKRIKIFVNKIKRGSLFWKRSHFTTPQFFFFQIKLVCFIFLYKFWWLQSQKNDPELIHNYESPKSKKTPKFWRKTIWVTFLVVIHFFQNLPAFEKSYFMRHFKWCHHHFESFSTTTHLCHHVIIRLRISGHLPTCHQLLLLEPQLSLLEPQFVNFHKLQLRFTYVPCAETNEIGIRHQKIWWIFNLTLLPNYLRYDST